MLQLWDVLKGRKRGMIPAVLATVVHTPASTLLLELVLRRFVGFRSGCGHRAASFAVGPFRHRKRNRGAPVPTWFFPQTALRVTPFGFG